MLRGYDLTKPIVNFGEKFRNFIHYSLRYRQFYKKKNFKDLRFSFDSHGICVKTKGSSIGGKSFLEESFVTKYGVFISFTPSFIDASPSLNPLLRTINMFHILS